MAGYNIIKIWRERTEPTAEDIRKSEYVFLNYNGWPSPSYYVCGRDSNTTYKVARYMVDGANSQTVLVCNKNQFIGTLWLINTYGVFSKLTPTTTFTNYHSATGLYYLLTGAVTPNSPWISPSPAYASLDALMAGCNDGVWLEKSTQSIPIVYTLGGGARTTSFDITVLPS